MLKDLNFRGTLALARGDREVEALVAQVRACVLPPPPPPPGGRGGVEGVGSRALFALRGVVLSRRRPTGVQPR